MDAIALTGPQWELIDPSEKLFNTNPVYKEVFDRYTVNKTLVGSPEQMVNIAHLDDAQGRARLPLQHNTLAHFYKQAKRAYDNPYGSHDIIAIASGRTVANLTTKCLLRGIILCTQSTCSNTTDRLHPEDFPPHRIYPLDTRLVILNGASQLFNVIYIHFDYTPFDGPDPEPYEEYLRNMLRHR